MSAPAPPPPPPPPPPPSNSNQPVEYFDLLSEVKWASKKKSFPDRTRRGRNQKLPSTKGLAKQPSSSSFPHIDIPKPNTPFDGPSAFRDINNSEFDSSFLDFMVSLSDSTSVVNELVNLEAIMLQKFQKECSISGMKIEIENKEQKHDEDVNKEEEHVKDEDKEMQVEIENTEEKKDEVGKYGNNSKFYLRRSKLRGKELVNQDREMQILLEEKEVPRDEKDEPEMDAYSSEFHETVAKTWNLRPRKPKKMPQNANASVSSKVGGGSVQKNKDKQLKRYSEKEQGIGGDQKKGKQKNNECKKSGKGKHTRQGQEGNDIGLPKLANFSLLLTSEEIAEDLLAMTGAKPPRKPKRRLKNVQRKIDFLTPGLGLDSITPDSYKVNEGTEKGKLE